MTIFWKMAWKNLWRNKRRTLATASAIITGFVGLNLLGGYILRVERYLRVNSIYVNHAGHLSIYKSGGLEGFYNNSKKYQINGQEIKDLQTQLQSYGEVEFSAPFLAGMGLIGNGEKSVPFIAVGVDPALEKKIQEHPLVHRWTDELVAQKNEPSFKDYSLKIPDAISVTKNLGLLIDRTGPFQNLSMSKREVQLAGTDYHGSFNAVNGTLSYQHTTGFALSEDTGLVAPLDLLRRLYDTDGATYLAVFLKENISISDFKTKLENDFKNKNLAFDIHPFDDDRISLFYVGTMGFLYIMAGFFVFLIFMVVALSIINTTAIGIIERKKEIGTLRALGFNEKQISWMFTQESILLTFVSLGIGGILTQIFAHAVNLLNIRFYPPGIAGDMQFVLTPDLWLCLDIALPLMIIAIAACYWVSNKQIKQPLAELLVSVA
ncbi:MAG: ABC transporter permease [Bdellovibrio sp.]